MLIAGTGIACAILGLLLAVFFLYPRIRELSGELTKLRTDIIQESTLRASAEERVRIVPRLEEELQLARQKLENAVEENASHREQLSELKKEIEKERQATEEKLKLYQDAEQKLTDTFKALSSAALESNNENFMRLGKSALETFQEQAKGDLQLKEKAIENLVGPLGESLQQVNEQIKELEKRRITDYTSLKSHLTSLTDTEEKLRRETANLVQALRKPKVRGRWGEIQLKNVVEFAGMHEHCDFVEQETVSGEDGIFRPDMVVHLPGNKQLVVDSKAPLEAYLDALEIEDPSEKQTQLLRHASQVKEHINKLSSKQYWNQFKDTPEFVVLFLPGENFFSAALEQMPKLFEYAIERKILLATPTTLIALLKSAHYGWRQEHIAENARKISVLGKELFDRISTLASHFSALKKSLDRTVENYNKAAASLESRVLVTARKFQDLGPAGDTDIPELEPVAKITRALNASEEDKN